MTVPLTVKTEPSKVKLLSPFNVLSPLAVIILLLASLLIVIVPATNEASEEDTELKPVSVKSSNVGLSVVCKPKSLFPPQILAVSAYKILDHQLEYSWCPFLQRHLNLQV